MPIDKEYFKKRHAESVSKGTDYLSMRDKHTASSPSVKSIRAAKLKAGSGKSWLADKEGVSAFAKALNKKSK